MVARQRSDGLTAHPGRTVGKGPFPRVASDLQWNRRGNGIKIVRTIDGNGGIPQIGRAEVGEKKLRIWGVLQNGIDPLNHPERVWRRVNRTKKETRVIGVDGCRVTSRPQIAKNIGPSEEFVLAVNHRGVRTGHSGKLTGQCK